MMVLTTLLSCSVGGSPPPHSYYFRPPPTEILDAPYVIEGNSLGTSSMTDKHSYGIVSAKMADIIKFPVRVIKMALKCMAN